MAHDVGKGRIANATTDQGRHDEFIVTPEILRSSEQARLARVLYDEMERLDPSQEDIEWDALSDRDRRFYELCVERLLAEIGRPVTT